MWERSRLDGLIEFCGQECVFHTSIDPEFPQESGRDQHFYQSFVRLSAGHRRPVVLIMGIIDYKNRFLISTFWHGLWV